MGSTRSVVQLEVPERDSELAADILWQAGPSAVLEVELGDGRVRLVADVADPARVPEGPAGWVRTVLVVDDDAYLDAWRTWAAPIRAGTHVVLQPSWIPPSVPEPDDLVVVLDPGRAFGSGSHESTRLAVAALEPLVRPGDSVLDVGCGSGVLAVVAARLGAARVVAIDVEPAAVEATIANATANGVRDRISASRADLAAVTGTYDLVIANIGGSVLFELAGDLVARVAPGGVLVASGILDDRADALVAACAPLVERVRSSEAGWAALVLSAPRG